MWLIPVPVKLIKTGDDDEELMTTMSTLTCSHNRVDFFCSSLWVPHEETLSTNLHNFTGIKREYHVENYFWCRNFFLTKSFEVCWRIKIFACKLSSLFCQLQVVTLWWQVEKVRVHKVHGIINLLLRLRWQTDNQLSRSNPHLTARDNTISCCVVLVIRQSELQPW